MSKSKSYKIKTANIPLDADRIRQARLTCRFSLEYVAQQVSINKMTLQRYESGDIRTISPDRLYRLARLYQTTPARLCGISPDTEYITSQSLHVIPHSADLPTSTGKRFDIYLHVHSQTNDKS